MDGLAWIRPRLTTKTFNPMATGADHGLKPDRIARQLRASLDRLGVDRVELYLAHEFDPDVPLAESAPSAPQADLGSTERIILMGSGRWSTNVYDAAARFRAATGASAFAYSDGGAAHVHPALDPFGVSVRERRDSGEHPHGAAHRG